MAKLYYSISETARMLGETTTTVRFWSNSFSRFLNPKRNAKGNRQFTEGEIETLRKIKYLSRDCGLSLDAVSRKLSKKEDGSDRTLLVRDALLRIRSRLLTVKESL